jgi:hypothetical protein
MLRTPAAPEEIEHPCSDGRPTADNTIEARLSELSRKLRQGTASPEELAEFGRLDAVG